MEILMADTASKKAAGVARRFMAAGHVVHTCRSADDAEALPCAALRGAACPLEIAGVDIAVGVGPMRKTGRLGDGEACAVRRRIPLVLLDRPHDELRPWAAAEVPVTQALDAVEAVHGAALPDHSDAARLRTRDWLERRGHRDVSVHAEVRRRHGALLVDLTVDGPMSEGEAEVLGAYVTQGVRRIDPWSRGIDVSVHAHTGPPAAQHP